MLLHILLAGLLVGGIVTAYYVVEGKFEVGDFVLYATYMQQLYEPLGHLGAYYRYLKYTIRLTTRFILGNPLNVKSYELFKGSENSLDLRIFSMPTHV